MNPLDFTAFANNGDFGYPYYYTSANNGAIVDKVHIINASNYQQYYNYRYTYNGTTSTSIQPGIAVTFNVVLYTGFSDDRAGFGAQTTRYTNGQLARHATPSAKALLLDPLSSITNAPYSPFSSSYANKLPQGTVYFDSTLKTLGVATSNNVTSSVVLSSHTGSLDISGSIVVSGSALLSLRPQHPLPAAASYPGAFAVSASSPIKPYFSDGTSWKVLY